MTSTNDSDCYIASVRPFSKMEKKIKEAVNDLNIRCFGFDGRKALLGIAPEDVNFLGSMSEKRIQNAEYLAGMGYRPAESSYVSHRRGYQFTDEEKSLSEKIKKECKKPKLCAVVIQGKGKNEVKTIVDSYDFREPIDPEFPFDLECHGEPFYSSRYKTLDEIKDILSNAGKQGHCFMPRVTEIKKNIPVMPNEKDEATYFDFVKYFNYS